MADEKKLLERKALDAFLFNNRKLKKYEIDDNERPDFILEKDGYKIGIEHFRADTILNEQRVKISGCLFLYTESWRCISGTNF